MKEVLVIGDSLPDAYHKALKKLKRCGKLVDCQDYSTTQKECSMTVQVLNPLKENRISKLFYGGAYDLKRYLVEMIDGDLDFMIGKSPSYPYTYHNRYAPYLEQTISELRNSPSTRRAIISTRNNETDTNSKDPSCLQTIHFFIRPDDNGINKLDLEVMFRSNDLPEAFFMNAYALIELQNSVAQILNLDIGTYSHRSESMHCYKKNFKALNKMVKRINSESLEDLSLNYEDDWKNEMIESVPKIRELIDDLRLKYSFE